MRDFTNSMGYASKTTSTRDRLKAANQELERIKTSTKTREMLWKVEKQIKMEREKALSKYELEVFKKKQDFLSILLDKHKDVDVAFLLDCTGSMSSYIQEAKNKITTLVDSITSKYENKVRLAFVGYRDHCDGMKRIETLQFTHSIAAFKNFVGGLVALGGGDAPEDVLGGLEAVAHLGWLSSSKLIIHIGDSPPHGHRFHNLSPHADHYFNGDPRGINVEDVFKIMKKMGLMYFFGKVNSSTDKMFNEFELIGGKDMVKRMDMSSANLMSSCFYASVTKTIEHTLSRTLAFAATGFSSSYHTAHESYEDKSLKDFTISIMKPEDTILTGIQKVHWLTCSMSNINDLSNIRHSIGSINHKWSTVMVKKATDPFAEGAQRISYFGQTIDYTSGFDNKNIVLKEFKHTGHNRDRRSDYIEIMETQCVASFLSTKFNVYAPHGSKKINFIAVSVAQVFDDNGAPKYFNVEPLLPEYEDFKKWNTNFGAVLVEEDILQAFSHWTYDITNGFLVVVDLQGIERGDEFGLTDPCINCKEPRFGSTNMGQVGIDQFFRTHSCNRICKYMSLKEIATNKKAKKQMFVE